MSRYVKLTTSNGILNIDNKPIALTANVNIHNNNIVTETIRATSTETSLSSNISTETSRAKSAELSLANNISKETSRATISEVILSSSISKETSRATISEVILSSSISTETSRATKSEGILSSSISTENVRASTLETQIINKIQSIIINAPTTLDTIGEVAIALSNNPSVVVSISSSIAIQTSKAISTETILSNSISSEVFLLSDLSFNGLIDITKTVAIQNEALISININIEASRATNIKNTISTNISNYNTSTIVPLKTSISNEISRAIRAETSLSSSLSLVNYNTKNIEYTTLTNVVGLEKNRALNFNKQPMLSYVPRSVDTDSNFETTDTDFGVLNYLGGTLRKSYWLKRNSEGASIVQGNDGGIGPIFNYIVVPPGLFYLGVEVLLQNTAGQIVYEQSLTLNQNDDTSEFNPTNINNFRRGLPGFHYRTLRNMRGDHLWADPGFVNSIVSLGGTVGPYASASKLYLKQFINIQWTPTTTNYYMKISYQLTRLG